MMLLAAVLPATSPRRSPWSRCAGRGREYLTYSRAPFLAAYVFGGHRRLAVPTMVGIAVLVVGLAAGALALPSYLQLRAQHSGAPVIPGTVLVASDEYRFRAWGAAIGMWRTNRSRGRATWRTRNSAEGLWRPGPGSPHNEWLRIFAEEGIVVGVIGLAFVIATAFAVRVPGWLGTGVLAGWLAYVIAASFNNPLLFVRVSAVAFAIAGVGLRSGRACAARARRADAADTTEAPSRGASRDAEKGTGTAAEPPP